MLFWETSETALDPKASILLERLGVCTLLGQTRLGADNS